MLSPASIPAVAQQAAAACAAAVPTRRLAVLGRGCDPVRARFAEQRFPALLGGNVDVESATSDEELWAKLAVRSYDVVFLAPGICHLTRMGAYPGEAVVERVQREYPATKVVFVESVEDGIPKLAAALGIAQYGGAVARNTADWPFAD